MTAGGRRVRDENWRENLAEDGERLSKKQVFFTWYMTPWQRELAREAAKKRDLSLLAYARRSLMAFVAKDLDIDYYTLMEGETVRPYGVVGGIELEQLDGKGRGPWQIDGLHE